MIGSPLYQVSAEHLAGTLALLVVPLALWLLRRRTAARLAPNEWLLAGLLLGSAAIHAGLLIGNDHGPAVGLLFAVDAIVLMVVARRVLRGGRAGRLGVLVLIGSIVAYWPAMINEPPDQLGLVTKLMEILALAIVLRPAPARRRRAIGSFARSLAICVLVIGTTATSWVGAFHASASDPAAEAGHNIHAGGVPPPGTVLPVLEPRAATPAERAAAAEFLDATRIALARYADPAQAAADGFHVAGLAGIDFHASNPSHEHDGHVFDPALPESLVYAVAPNGRPVLLGAVFQMPDLGRPGPAIGGPLTVWHAHEEICISLTPPALAGLLGPMGTCPVGSIILPRTAQMIHVWIVPGAPEPFGDLNEAWRRSYLDQVAAAR